ncbi:MAG TPA: hypothetical protein DDY91_11070 [Planctomycetaceae bacterium]|nr:hypothetical protein [Planctomycetaceae bacterium]
MIRESADRTGRLLPPNSGAASLVPGLAMIAQIVAGVTGALADGIRCWLRGLNLVWGHCTCVSPVAFDKISANEVRSAVSGD